MKLTTEKASQVLAGLNGLDGYQRVVKGVGGQETTVLVPYNIDGTALRTIYRDMAKLRPHIDEFNEVARKVFLRITDGREKLDGEKSPEDAVLLEQYNRETRAMLDAEIEVDLKPLLLSMLIGSKDKPTRVPNSLLVLMAPIITDDLGEDEDDEPDKEA